jgi:hypothetical protein
MNKWISLGISALSDFIIVGVGAFTAIGGSTWPSTYQLAICAGTGLVMAARGVQKALAVPPQ